MNGLFVLILLGALVALGWGLVSPSHLSKTVKLQKVKTRKHVGLSFGLLSLAAFIGVGVTAPPQQQPSSQLTSHTAQTQATTATSSQPVIETKDVTVTKDVPFVTTNYDDATLPKGQTRITQTGKNGIETDTYSVTYKDGSETGRTLKSQVVTTQPTTQFVGVGTYVKPTPVSSGSGYVNVDGNYVPSPSSDPTGATAQCGDGTYSYSQHRSGTCSHHGGVARWL